MAATAQFLSGLFLVSLPGLDFAREIRYITLVQGCAAVLAIVLNLVLASTLEYVGSAIAMVLSYMALNALEFLELG